MLVLFLLLLLGLCFSLDDITLNDSLLLRKSSHHHWQWHLMETVSSHLYVMCMSALFLIQSPFDAQFISARNEMLLNKLTVLYIFLYPKIIYGHIFQGTKKVHTILIINSYILWDNYGILLLSSQNVYPPEFGGVVLFL